MLWRSYLVMTHHFHDAFDGEPVGVHVGYRHKDAHHLTAVVEVFIFFHFFDDNDFTIGRSHDHILCFAGKDSHRTSEEIDDDGEYDDKNSEDNIESERATLKKQPIVECCDHQSVAPESISVVLPSLCRRCCLTLGS